MAGEIAAPSFFEQVWQVAMLIPPGRVTTYGAIAAFIGSPGAARMVGWALNGAHKHPEAIPAHRVVNRLGMLSGKHHFPGENLMEELLQSEGVEVVEGKIINFEIYFWDPSTERI